MEDGYYVCVDGKIELPGPISLYSAIGGAQAMVDMGGKGKHVKCAWVKKYKDGVEVEWDSETDDWK